MVKKLMAKDLWLMSVCNNNVVGIVRVVMKLLVTVIHQQQFFSELPYPEQSHNTNFW